MSEARTILEVNNLDAGYPGNLVLRDVNFTLKERERLAIIGQNGSGKSTLLKTICGLLLKKGGQIQYKGERLNGTAPHELTGKGISYFAQGGLIMPALTVQEHLQLVDLQSAEKYQKNHIQETIALFPKLMDMRKKRAGNLSGGERQMLSFAILSMQDTSTWLLDEPTAGLAPEMVDFTIDFLMKANQERGIAMLMVEHNMEVAFQLASHVAITKEGTLTQKFTGQEFLQKNDLDKVFFN